MSRKSVCTARTWNKIEKAVSSYLNTDEVPANKSQNIHARPGSFFALSKGLSESRSRMWLSTNRLKSAIIKIYRNGDPYFTGSLIAVNHAKYPTFDRFMEDVNRLRVARSNGIMFGVRYLFSLDGKLIKSLDQLVPKQSYVGSSTPDFKDLNYKKNFTPFGFDGSTHDAEGMIDTKFKAVYGRHLGIRGAEQAPEHPHRIVLIKVGKRPRTICSLTLTKKAVNSLVQVLAWAAKWLRFDTNPLRRLYSYQGHEICTLRQLYEDRIYFATAKGSLTSADRVVSGLEADYIEKVFNRMSIPCPTEMVMNQRIGKKSQNPPAARKEFEGDCDDTEIPVSQSSSGNLSDGTGRATPTETDLKKVERKTMNEVCWRYKLNRELFKTEVVTLRECRDRQNPGRRLALQIINKARMRNEHLVLLQSELSILRRLQHRNILQLVDSADSLSTLYIVTELMSESELKNCGNLFYCAACLDGVTYDEVYVSSIIRQLLLALQYIHSIDTVHRNITPDSILIFKNWKKEICLRLGDFRLACLIIKEDSLLDVCGEPQYRAPEILTGTGYGTAVDLWSVGLLTYLLMSGFQAFDGLIAVQEFQEYPSSGPEFPKSRWEDVSENAKGLIGFLLQSDANTRLSAKEALKHPWILNPKKYASGCIDTSVPRKIKQMWKNPDANISPALTFITNCDREVIFENPA